MSIKDKVAIVTGASSGIGLETSRLLTKKGVKVALVARSEKKLLEISKELPDSSVFVCDMSKENEIREMVKKVYKHFGRIDILVNNAGRGYDAPVEKINIKKLRDIFDLNFVGPLVVMQQVMPFMKKNGGSIVNISSGTALMNIPNMSAYSSSKKALVGFSLTAREELFGDNIKVSVVYPFITKTDFEKNTIKDSLQSDEQDEEFFKRADEPSYVAEKILFAIESGEAEVFAHEWMKDRK